MGRKAKYPEDVSILQDRDRLSYFAGYFSADGSLPKTHCHRNKLVITSAAKDRDFLQGVADMLVFGYTPYFIESTNSYVISVTAPTIRSYLESIGLTPNKTYDLSIDFTKVNPVYFLRGVIDGDGYIRCDQNKYVELVSAAENFLIQLQSMFGGVIRPTSTKASRLYWNTNGSVELTKILPIEDYMLARKSSLIKVVSEYKPSTVYENRRKESNYGKI